MGVVTDKGLTLRPAQQHGRKSVPRLLDHVAKDEPGLSYLVTQRFSLVLLEDAPCGYETFKNEEEGDCVRVVFTP